MASTSGRVRKPPGGDSSFNIFGIASEPNETKKAAGNSCQKVTEIEESRVNTDIVVAKEEETMKELEDKKDDGKEEKDVEAEDEENEKERKESADQNSTDAATVSVDVKDSPAKGETQNSPENTKSSKQRGTYNPITGEPYGSSEKTETAKSVGHTRVRQPPGGASSKLW